MTLDQIRQRILADDEFVLEELKRIQLLFKMKQVIRYNEKRQVEIDSESVAEHVYGMQILNDYFLPLEQGDEYWNYTVIQQMTVYHDIDEIVTGDRLGFLKTEQDRLRERDAEKEIVSQLSLVTQDLIAKSLEQYNKQETVEARFVKAIDKIEPIFHLINDNGKRVMHKNGTTLSQHKMIKDKYVEPFPYIKRFNEVLTEHMLENGFFSLEDDKIVV